MRLFILFAILLAGCASSSNEVVNLDEPPKERKTEREKINEKQRQLFSNLAEKSQAMKKDLESLDFISQSEVNLWPQRAVVDIRLIKGKNNLTLNNKREILRIIVKYDYSANNTRLLWRRHSQ